MRRAFLVGAFVLGTVTFWRIALGGGLCGTCRRFAPPPEAAGAMGGTSYGLTAY